LAILDEHATIADLAGGAGLEELHRRAPRAAAIGAAGENDVRRIVVAAFQSALRDHEHGVGLGDNQPRQMNQAGQHRPRQNLEKRRGCCRRGRQGDTRQQRGDKKRSGGEANDATGNFHAWAARGEIKRGPRRGAITGSWSGVDTIGKDVFAAGP
jgi:hypothetical protein